MMPINAICSLADTGDLLATLPGDAHMNGNRLYLGSRSLMVGCIGICFCLGFGSTSAISEQQRQQDVNPELLDRQEQLDSQRKRQMAQLSREVDIRVINENGKQRPAKLVDRPLLNHIDIERRQHGSLWIWTDSERPVAISELFSNNLGDEWNYAMVSVSEGQLVGEFEGRRWRSRSAGVEFRAIPMAPDPSTRPAIRLAQMRRLARRFTAHSITSKRTELRLLTQPLYRYRVGEQITGGIFTFVHSNTNPELILLIQANGSAWRFGVNRCTLNELHLEFDGNEVWSDPYDSGDDADSPFFVWWR